jgi:energy-coupling factor transporter ATP-binding protein EcfA2
MITSVEIDDFRTCQHTVFEPRTTVSALFGHNGAGKTTILEAIYRVSKAASGLRRVLLGELRLLPRRTSLDIQLGQSTVRYELEPGDNGQTEARERFSVNDNGNWLPLIVREGSQVVNLRLAKDQVFQQSWVSCLKHVRQLFPQDDDTSKLCESAVRVLRSVRLHHTPAEWAVQADLRGDPDEFISPREPDLITEALHEEYDRWNDELEGPPWHSVPHRLFKMRRDSPEDFDEASALLGHLGLEVIDKITISDTTRAGREVLYSVNFCPSDPELAARYPRGLWFSELPAGIRRVVEIVVALVYEADSVVLWDHPETDVDEDLLEKAFSLMRTYAEGGQLIVASHSQTVLNSLEPEEFHLVELANGQTLVRNLPPDEVQEADRYIQESGTFAEYLKAFQEA